MNIWYEECPWYYVYLFEKNICGYKHPEEVNESK